MTEKEINALKSGPDFDRAVAEALGWKGIGMETIPGVGCPDLKALVGTSPEGRNELLPAWTLFCGASLGLLPEAVKRWWVCELSPSPAGFLCRFTSKTGQRREAESNFLTEAVCKAFLLAHWAEKN